MSASLCVYFLKLLRDFLISCMPFRLSKRGGNPDSLFFSSFSAWTSTLTGRWRGGSSCAAAWRTRSSSSSSRRTPRENKREKRTEWLGNGNALFFFFFNLGSSLSFSGKVRVVKERKEKLVDEILRVLVLFSPPPFFSLFYWWSVTKWWGRRKREENFEKKEVGWEEIFRFVARRSPDFYPRIFEKKCRPPKRFFFFENPLSRALKIFWCSKKFYLYFVSLPLDTKKIKISFEIPAPPQKKSY